MEDNEIVEEVQTDGPSEAESQARKNGWKPLEEYDGDAAKWRSAEEFNDFGDKVTPLIKKQRDEWQRKYTELEAKFKNVSDVSQDLIKRTIEKERKEYQSQLDFVKTQLKNARLNGNTQEAAVYEEERDKLIENKPEEYKAPPAPTVADTRVWDEWREDNPWFDKDPDLASYAEEVGIAMRAKNVPLFGRAYFDAIGERVKKMHPDKFRTRRTAVESASAGASSRKQGTTYDSLPADVKKACDKYVATFGNGKDTAAKRDEYIRTYNGE